jgi:hypothetical protein
MAVSGNSNFPPNRGRQPLPFANGSELLRKPRELPNEPELLPPPRERPDEPTRPSLGENRIGSAAAPRKLDVIV